MITEKTINTSMIVFPLHVLKLKKRVEGERHDFRNYTPGLHQEDYYNRVVTQMKLLGEFIIW